MSYAKKIEKLFAQSNVTVNIKLNDRIVSNALKALDESNKTKFILMPAEAAVWSRILWRGVGYLATAFLIIALAGTSFILYEKVGSLKEQLEQARNDLAAVPTEDSATINFYFKEHEDMLAQYASHNESPKSSVQMHTGRDNILYYEMFDNPSDYMYPGVIVRRPPFLGQIESSRTPAISNGHTLSLSEARETADFDLSAPSRFFPGYCLDQIRRIENRDAMQMLYTNGINSISLFEQPLDGQRSLGPQDFREYAVFQYKGKAGGTILAWRNDALSYVLIGNVEMSQLMDMAQSIGAGK